MKRERKKKKTNSTAGCVAFCGLTVIIFVLKKFLLKNKLIKSAKYLIQFIIIKIN